MIQGIQVAGPHAGHRHSRRRVVDVDLHAGRAKTALGVVARRRDGYRLALVRARGRGRAVVGVDGGIGVGPVPHDSDRAIPARLTFSRVGRGIELGQSRRGHLTVIDAGEAVVVRIRIVGTGGVVPRNARERHRSQPVVAREINVREVGVSHIRVVQIGVAEVGAREVVAGHVRARQGHPRAKQESGLDAPVGWQGSRLARDAARGDRLEISTSEHGTLHIGVVQDAAKQVDVLEVRASQVGSGERHPYKSAPVRLVLTNSAPDRSAWLRSRPARSRPSKFAPGPSR